MLCPSAASASVLRVAQAQRHGQQRRAMTVPSAGTVASGGGPAKRDKLFSFGLLSDVQVGGQGRSGAVIFWLAYACARTAGTGAPPARRRRPCPPPFPWVRPPALPGPPPFPTRSPSPASIDSIQTRRTAPASTARRATTATRCSSWTGRWMPCAARAWPARCTWVRRWARSSDSKPTCKPVWVGGVLSCCSASNGALSFLSDSLCCFISAGDIVDFHNTQLPACPDSGLPASETALRDVLRHFDRLGRPTLHLLG